MRASYKAHMVVCGLCLTVALSFLQLSQAGTLPSPPPSPSITLKDALARVDAVAGVGAALARAEGTRTAAGLTPRWLNPTIELRGENWAAATHLPLDVFATATQPLEVFGTRGARIGLAMAEAVDAELGVFLAKAEATRWTARLFLDAVGTRDHLAIVHEQQQGLDEIVQVLRQRVNEGISAEADLRKFEAERAQVEAVAIRLTLTLARRLRDLETYLGLPPLSANQLLRPSPAVVNMPSDGPELAAALERRADVASARGRRVRAESNVGLAVARARPDLALTGGLKRTAGYNTGVVAVQFPVPVFDHNGAAVARARGEARAVTFELDAVRARARAEAMSWFAELQALQAYNARAADSLVAPAIVARTAALAAFREGTFDPLRLVDAERAWTEARRTQVALEVEAVLVSIETRLALGLEAVP